MQFGGVLELILVRERLELSRQFERTAAQGASRFRRAWWSDEESLDIRQMYEEKEEYWDPAADGFVFSDSQLEQAVQARNCKRLGDEAAEYIDFRTEAAPDNQRGFFRRA